MFECACACACACTCVCVCMCVCLPHRLLITSSIIWHDICIYITATYVYDSCSQLSLVGTYNYIGVVLQLKCAIETNLTSTLPSL